MEKDELIERLTVRMSQYCHYKDEPRIARAFNELIAEWDAFHDSLNHDESDGIEEQIKHMNIAARRLMFAMGRSAPDDIMYLVQKMFLKVAVDIEDAAQTERITPDFADSYANGFRERVGTLFKAICPASIR